MDDNGGDDAVYAVLYRASSLDEFGPLADPDSLASRLARARGGGEVVDRGDAAGDGDEGDAEADGYGLRLEEGRISVATGYMMRFVGDEYRDLDVFDVLTVPDLKSYPVPASALESLPLSLRGRLERDGSLQVSGRYDYDASRFESVSPGWDDASEDPYDRLMTLAGRSGSLSAAIDYLLVVEGPERWTAECVAEARGVTVGTVQDNVRSVRRLIEE